MDRESRVRFWLIFTAITVGLLYLLAPVLTPFLFATLLAYLGDPLIDRLEARKMDRTWAVTLVFAVIIVGLLVLVLVLVPISAHQFSGLMQRLPQCIDWFQTRIMPGLHDALGLDPAMPQLELLRKQLLEHAREIGDLAGGLLRTLRASSSVVFNWIANLVLVPVVTFYLLRDWDVLVAKVHDLLPRRIEPVVSKLTQESDEVIGAFLRGQFIVMAALSLIYSVGLAIIGLEFSLLIGLLAGLVSFVPYLGLIIGAWALGAVFAWGGRA